MLDHTPASMMNGYAMHAAAANFDYFNSIGMMNASGGGSLVGNLPDMNDGLGNVNSSAGLDLKNESMPMQAQAANDMCT